MSTVTAATATPPRTELPVLAEECCTVLVREPITASQAEGLARTLKALADPTRLRLVSMVAAHEGGEACVCDLTGPLGLTQPTTDSPGLSAERQSLREEWREFRSTS